jgi:CRP-like cAMP-binding protein
MSFNTKWQTYATKAEFKQGDYIFRQRELSEAIYIIASGRVAILKESNSQRAITLGYRGPGEIIGEISLLMQFERTASVMATEPTIVYVVERDEFWQLLRKDEGFQDLVIHTLTQCVLTADNGRLEAAKVENKLRNQLTDLSIEQQRLQEENRLRHQLEEVVIGSVRRLLARVLLSLDALEKNQDPSLIKVIRNDIEQTLPDLDELERVISSSQSNSEIGA